MNIGIDIRALMSSYRTGVGELIVELLNSVFNIDKSNQYFLFYNSYHDISERMPGWKQPNVHYVVTRIPNKLLNASLRFFNRPHLDKFIIKNYKLKIKNLDIFFSPNPNYTSVSPDTKHILFIHDLTLDFFPRFFIPRARLWHWLINPKKQCRRANLILTPSENTKRDVVDYYGVSAEKIKVLYPGLSQTFVEYLNLNEEKRENKKREIIKKYHLPENFILFLGTIEPRKNIINIINAFEMVHNSVSDFGFRISDFSLVLAGAPGWKNKTIYERANKSPLRDKIKFLGFVDPSDKPALYAAANLFVYPSFYEGFGFPVLEAMAMGVPVITSNRSSISEITGPNAYLVNPNKPEEISEGIHRLLGDHNPCNPNQIREILANFNWPLAAQKFLSIINSQ